MSILCEDSNFIFFNHWLKFIKLNSISIHFGIEIFKKQNLQKNSPHVFDKNFIMIKHMTVTIKQKS
jgi:hypothetical protein